MKNKKIGFNQIFWIKKYNDKNTIINWFFNYAKTMKPFTKELTCKEFKEYYLTYEIEVMEKIIKSRIIKYFLIKKLKKVVDEI